MNKGDAYRVVVDELRSIRAKGYHALLPTVGKTVRRIVRIGQEDVNIETTARFDDARQDAIRIHVTAFGPSCWAMERLEESAVVRR